MREIRVEETYSSKSVLVTGATGFLGKVLVEKLLRSCKRINKIYILIRAKKGSELRKRFDDYKNSIVFENLRKSDRSTLEKLVLVEGDLMISPSVGISESDLEMLQRKVHIVFHCAASVRFDEPIESALKINLISTRNLLNLAENFNLLEAFIHISTAFSNTNQKRIMEKIYEPIYDYKTAIALVEREDKVKLKELTAFALKTFPNTYIFSKNMTEQLVRDRSGQIPIAIVRPSIVCPSYKEPHPGWVDNYNGPMGVLIGASSGLLRTMHGKGHLVTDLIPCDFAVNNIIVAGASVSTSENKKLEIYNCISSKQLPITWNQFLDLSQEIYKKYPSTKVLWYPGGGMSSSYCLYLIYFTLFQIVPACFIDFALILAGKKTWALKLQKRIFESQKYFEHFVNNAWEWDNKNTEVLHKLVSMHERSIFNFDVSLLDYKSYIVNWVLGSRRFMLKLEDKTIPEAKRKFLALFWLDLVTKTVFYFGIGYFIYNVLTYPLQSIQEALAT